MQTTINVEQAFGIAGEIYDLTPYRVDAREVATTATFGGVAGVSADGEYGTMGGSYSTFAGIFVRPKEEVSYGTSGNPLAPTLTVPAGRTVQIMSMGRVVVPKPSGVWADGAALYVTSAGVLTTTSSGNTLIGKIVKGGASADTLAVVQIG